MDWERGRKEGGDWVSCVHYSKLPPPSHRGLKCGFLFWISSTYGGETEVCVCVCTVFSWDWEEGNARNAEEEEEEKDKSPNWPN